MMMTVHGGGDHNSDDYEDYGHNNNEYDHYDDDYDCHRDSLRSYIHCKITISSLTIIDN